jgi:cytoskeletal protein CcmA (bactofilin family)
MANEVSTLIGRSTFVRGRINGSGDLEIAGRVEGDVSCVGEVVVDASGLVAANVSATRIVVRGAVKGDLAAEEAIVIEATARIVGDLRAPRIAIAQGALVRGHVQTGAAGAARPRAAQAQVPAARTSQASVTTRAAAPAPAPSKASTNAAAAAAAKKNGTASPPRGATLAGARPGPPPPVVPVLKKGTKALQKKRH